MKMAKASAKDIDAAGDLLSLLMTIDRGNYPGKDGDEDAPQWFDEDDPEHLRAFYDQVMATMHKAPGFPGRVIGGMCYVILHEKNEIVDPESDTLELHPKLLSALNDAARYRWLRDKSEPGICAFYLSVGKAFDGVKFTRETVDEAIDAQVAAMAATQAKGNGE